MMGAAFFSVEPQYATAPRSRAGMASRLRQVHRWVSVVFSLTVAANFAAIVWGQPPALITYAPLPPLLVLTMTGLLMLARHVGRSRRARRPLQTQG